MCPETAGTPVLEERKTQVAEDENRHMAERQMMKTFVILVKKFGLSSAL